MGELRAPCSGGRWHLSRLLCQALGPARGQPAAELWRSPVSRSDQIDRFIPPVVMGPFEAPTPHAADREETRAEVPPRAGNGGRPVARRNADRRGARGGPLLAGVRGKEAKRIAVTLSQGGCSAKCVLRGAAFAGKPRGASQGEEAPSGQRPAGAQTRGDEEEEPAGREVAVGAGGGPRAAGHLRTCPPGRGPFCHRGRAPSRHAGATRHVVPVHAPKWGVSPSEENALSEMPPPLGRE